MKKQVVFNQHFVISVTKHIIDLKKSQAVRNYQPSS